MNAPVATLTPRQGQVLRFLAAHIAREGYAPSVREIAAAFGIASTNAVGECLDRLERAGAITRQPHKARALTITRLGRTLSKTAATPAKSAAPTSAVEQSTNSGPEADGGVIAPPSTEGTEERR